MGGLRQKRGLDDSLAEFSGVGHVLASGYLCAEPNQQLILDTPSGEQIAS
jgi:hypothetical protein